MHVFVTGGSNGKSSLEALILTCFGDYATSIPAGILTTKRIDPGRPMPELMACKNKRLVFFNETEEGTNVNSAVLKELTGGDKLMIRGMYAKEPDCFVFHALPILLCNNMPNVNDRTNAMWRRIVSIPFSTKFVLEPRPEFQSEQLMVEGIEQKFPLWKNIFATCLVQNRYDTMMGYDEDEPILDYLKIPDSVINNTKKYRRDTDYIADFVLDCLEITGKKEDLCAWTSQMCPTFKVWFKNNCPNDKEPNPSIIRNLLKDFLKCDFGTFHTPHEKKNTYGWKGVRLSFQH